MPVLGGIVLSNDISREDLLNHSRVDARMVRSRAYTPLIWGQSFDLLEFNLIGKSDAGIITHAVFKDLYALAAVPMATYDLSYNGDVYSVCFRTWEQPVVEAVAIGPREQITDDDLYHSVVIKLMEA
jgi:hypothetical protein